jgi:probable HAF family extracellular repeat protein
MQHARPAEGINNRGEVVGFYADEAGRHGFVAQQSPR